MSQLALKLDCCQEKENRLEWQRLFTAYTLMNGHQHQRARVAPDQEKSVTLLGFKGNIESETKPSPEHDGTTTVSTYNEEQKVVLPLGGLLLLLNEQPEIQGIGGFKGQDDNPLPPIELPPAVVDSITELLFPENTSTPLGFQEWLDQLSYLLAPYLEHDPLLEHTLTPASYFSQNEESPTPGCSSASSTDGHEDEEVEKQPSA